MSASFKAAALVVLCFVAINIPFLGQAFHMDDAIYLLVARNVSRHPAFPQGIGAHVEGIWADDLASMEHPPLTIYLLAAGAWMMRGFSEIPLHSLFLVFSVVLGFAMHSFSRRFIRHPLAATALLLSTPVVFITSHTLMTDLPHLSLWMLAVAMFTKGVDETSASWAFGGASVAALATYVSPAALSLVPLLALYAFARRRPAYLMPAVVLPLLATGLWWLVNYVHFGRFTPAFLLHYYPKTEDVFGWHKLGGKCLYAILAVGGLTISPVILCSSSYRKFLSFGLPLGMGLTVVSEARGYPPLLQTAVVLFFAFGFAALVGSLCNPLKSEGANGDYAAGVFLKMWLFGALLLAVLFYMTGSARYLLPLVPPLVVLTVRRLEREMPLHRLRIVLGAAVFTSSMLSIGLGVADFNFAGVYRSFASHLSSAANLQLRRIWFTGEWGFRAYLESLGGEELGRGDARPRAGDLLVIPSTAVPYSTLFSSNVRHESIVMVAPSRVSFEVPAPHYPATLFFLAGLPGWQRSDGLDFFVQWNGRVIFSRRLLPESGRIWRPVEIPLPDSELAAGTLVLSVQVGASGNAEADWLAISHARVRTIKDETESVRFGLREHLSDAKIFEAQGVNYHTPGNKAVFEMPVWLDQEPAVRLLDECRYACAWPFRLLDRRSRAGFWSMGWGLLPFSIGINPTPIDEIRIFEVIRAADAFDERDPSWFEK